MWLSKGSLAQGSCHLGYLGCSNSGWWHGGGPGWKRVWWQARHGTSQRGGPARELDEAQKRNTAFPGGFGAVAAS